MVVLLSFYRLEERTTQMTDAEEKQVEEEFERWLESKYYEAYLAGYKEAQREMKLKKVDDSDDGD